MVTAGAVDLSSQDNGAWIATLVDKTYTQLSLQQRKISYARERKERERERESQRDESQPFPPSHRYYKRLLPASPPSSQQSNRDQKCHTASAEHPPPQGASSAGPLSRRGRDATCMCGRMGSQRGRQWERRAHVVRSRRAGGPRAVADWLGRAGAAANWWAACREGRGGGSNVLFLFSFWAAGRLCVPRNHPSPDSKEEKMVQNPTHQPGWAVPRGR